MEKSFPLTTLHGEGWGMRIITILTAGVLSGLLLIVIVPSARAAALRFPVRSMTLANVRGIWGNPLAKTGPIGIHHYRQWIYPHFVVVFEERRVIASIETHPLRLPRPDPLPSLPR